MHYISSLNQIRQLTDPSHHWSLNMSTFHTQCCSLSQLILGVTAAYKFKSGKTISSQKKQCFCFKQDITFKENSGETRRRHYAWKWSCSDNSMGSWRITKILQSSYNSKSIFFLLLHHKVNSHQLEHWQFFPIFWSEVGFSVMQTWDFRNQVVDSIKIGFCLPIRLGYPVFFIVVLISDVYFKIVVLNKCSRSHVAAAKHRLSRR